VFQQKEGTTISTMHGVRGAEFDTVIAFGLLEDYVPHSRVENRGSIGCSKRKSLSSGLQQKILNE